MNPLTQTFPEHLAAVAAAHPHLVALEGGSTRVTYAELLSRARALGVWLRALGAGPERIVGLCFEKSPDYVIALLGCWFAGAAFVPLDPRLPAERLALIARECELPLALVQPGLEPLLSGLTPRILRLSDAPALPSSEPLAPPLPEHLAYVIYTSGTTGVPKGVLVPHAGLVSLLRAQIQAFGLGPSCRSLLFLSTSFDASLSDIGTALLSGATLCVEPDSVLRGDEGLPALLASLRITHLDLPPSLLRVFSPESFPDSLQTLIIGGEPCPPAVVRRWASRLRVVNVYGPTEATICSSLCVCDSQAWQRPLLGQPVPHVHWRVLDEAGQPVAPGGSGELYLGGLGLARGYLHRPELTASRFVVLGGERFYRTADRVLLHPDGELEFLGRVDRQVKVRGLLIEPEELEAHLLRHPALQAAAVLKRPLGPQGEGLVAFFVPRPSEPVPSPEALRTWLSAAVPRWMLPQRLEPLDALPRTLTGKVDFNALARVPLDARPEASPFVAPSSPREARLCALWQRVLGLERVGVTDDFFALGGDSLAVLRVVAAAEALGLPLPPSALHERPTVRELLSWLDSHPAHDEGLEADALRADVALGPEWQTLLARAASRPEKTDMGGPARTALVTGATGFLGARLVQELLVRTPARLVCLVRARDAAEARERLLHALVAQGTPPSASEASRLEALPGALERPRMGLSSPVWERLAHEVEAIYHSAAQVHMVLPYSALRGPNVTGTQEVLRLMAEGAPKALHDMSTLSVFVSTDRGTGRMDPSDALEGPFRVYGGYAQTKWAAEWLLRSARGAAGPVAYYRLGLLTGDTRTGRGAPRDFLALFFRGLAALGCVPEGLDESLAVDVTPIDYAAAAVAWLSLRPLVPGQAPTWHLANPRPLRLGELLSALRAFGVRLERVPAEAWRARLAGLVGEEVGASQAAAFLGLCRGLSGEAFGRQRTMDLFQATGADFGLEATHAALEGSGLGCPPPSEALLHAYLRCVLGAR